MHNNSNVSKTFFDELNISYVLSPPTNIDIMEKAKKQEIINQNK